MSYLTSTKLAKPQYVVAIAGASGSLGKDVTSVFLTEYRPFFSKIIALVRDPSSAGAQAIAAKGAELRQVSEANTEQSYAAALNGVDVLVNVLTAHASGIFDAVFAAALKAGVKVYFPSEFGADLRINSFPGFDAEDWIQKRAHARKARELAGGKVKIVSLYIGLFLEGALYPWFGIDNTNNVYAVVGSADKKIALTSKTDIGRALSELSLLALTPDGPAVPDDVQIAGSLFTIRELKEAVESARKARGKTDQIEIKTEDLTIFKETVRTNVLADPKTPLIGHLRILAAEGQFDWTTSNNNELVNPHGRVWKWISAEDYIKGANL